YALIPTIGQTAYLGNLIGLNVMQLVCFFIFWAINIYIIHTGIDSIKRLENWAAPFLLVIGIALLVWAWIRVGSLGKILEASYTLSKTTQVNFWRIFWPGLTAMVGFWATLSLNIPDFSRYAKSQKDQIYGQAIGLPGTMVLYAFIGIA